MNNKEFDELIKSNLDGFVVTPSTLAKKKLSRKMMFKNIWIFHKKKALFILLLIGTTSLTLFEFSFKTDKQIVINNIPSDKNKIQKKIETQNFDENKSINETQNKNLLLKTDTKANYINKATKNKVSNFSNKTGLTKTEYYKYYNQQKPKEILVNDVPTSLENTTAKKLKDDFQLKNIKKIDAQQIVLKNINDIVDYKYEENLGQDYVSQKKGNLSIDAFITPYNQTKIINTVDNQFIKNWWDFHKENKYVNSKLEAGLRINYEWKNIVFTSGIKLERLVEYTPKYIYEKTDDELLLGLLSVSEISGVQVNEVDSAHYVFYAEQDQELIKSIEENSYNQFNYLSFPLKLGYEFKASKFSVILQAGVAYNRLIRARGNYLRRYQNEENIDVYFNKGIELALLSNNNSMLKPSYFSFLTSISGNARISPSLDLFGEFTFSKSQNLITQVDYFNHKTLTNFGTNFGVKYYLKPRQNKALIEEKLF